MWHRLDRPLAARECTSPAHYPESRMFLRPFRDFRRGEKHALVERTAALEIEVLSPAVGGLCGKTDRQDEIDHVHAAPPAWEPNTRRRPPSRTYAPCVPLVPNGTNRGYAFRGMPVNNGKRDAGPWYD